MASPILHTPPPLNGQFGYTCKIWLTYLVEREYLGGVHYTWFARELNPMDNGNSSNPLELFAMLSRAVQKKDVNHPKIKDLSAFFWTSSGV